MNIKVCNTIAKKPSWASRIICWWEKTDYSHTIVIIDDTVYEAVGKGFLSKPLNDWLKDNKILLSTDCVSKFSLTNTDQLTIEGKAKEMVGTRYGFLNLLGCAFNDMAGVSWFADGQKSLICSEAIYYIFAKWLPPISELPDFVSPKDIERLFDLDMAKRN